MIQSLRHRLARDDRGFTLIELLVVIIILGVATLGGYCVVNTVPGTVQYHKSGPSGDIKAGNC